MINWQELSEQQQQQTLARPALADRASLRQTVSDIIAQVREQGDSALLELSEKFDGVSASQVALSSEQKRTILATLGASEKAAIELAYGQIKRFHEAQIAQDVTVETTNGVTCELLTAPISAVGLYVPGGSAPLPSTVLMLGVPSQIAGCERVVLCTPPIANVGGITPEILYAAQLCGINEIYCTGGAQAIAAMAYGTQSIAPVDKIFGPGNSFVTEAKQQVAQDPAGAAIDMPAGPSEVLVIADANANPAFVAADLLSQAEHGPDSQVILVSDSNDLIVKTEQQITAQLAQLPRADIARQALTNSRNILADSIEQVVDISNLYAPEHLIVQVDNARALLPKLRNAASIFLGAYTPESAGDYASGTNHVLPTYGYSKVLSSLSLVDFTRRYTVQEITPQGLQSIGPAIMTLAAAEGLDAHKNAVGLRLDSLVAEKFKGSVSSSLVEAIAIDTPDALLVDRLIRSELKQLKPYESARRLFSLSDSNDIDTKWLNANENPQSPKVSADPALYNRYPDFQPDPLINAYSQYADVSPQQVLATRGADEGIELLIRTFCAPKQNIVICPPTYGMYAISAETTGINVLTAPLLPSMQLDVELTISQAKQAQIVFICSPNNPTGDVMNRADLIKVLESTQGQCLVVADEAYIEFCPEATVRELLDIYPNLVILRTLSKAFALAGIRCGFMLAAPAVIQAAKKVIAPYPIPAPVAQMATQALSSEGQNWMRNCVAELNQRRDKFISEASTWRLSGRVFASQTNFVLIQLSDALIQLMTAEDVMARFLSKHILLRNQSKQIMLNNTIRVTIGNAEEMAAVTEIFQQIEAQLDQ